MKASEIILELQKLVNNFGDREVYSGGADYPEKVKWVGIEKQGNSYEPKGCFKIK